MRENTVFGRLRCERPLYQVGWPQINGKQAIAHARRRNSSPAGVKLQHGSLARFRQASIDGAVSIGNDAESHNAEVVVHLLIDRGPETSVKFGIFGSKIHGFDAHNA